MNWCGMNRTKKEVLLYWILWWRFFIVGDFIFITLLLLLGFCGAKFNPFKMSLNSTKTCSVKIIKIHISPKGLKNCNISKDVAIHGE